MKLECPSSAVCFQCAKNLCTCLSLTDFNSSYSHLSLSTFLNWSFISVFLSDLREPMTTIISGIEYFVVCHLYEILKVLSVVWWPDQCSFPLSGHLSTSPRLCSCFHQVYFHRRSPPLSPVFLQMTTNSSRIFCTFVTQSVNTYSSMFGEIHLPQGAHNLKRIWASEAAKDEG